MYKVFDSQNEVVFTNNENYKSQNGDEKLSDPALNRLPNDSKEKLVIYSESPLNKLKSFYYDHQLIIAAGGLVKMNSEFLWIYRNGKWDLPKGKVEKDETVKSAAKREVIEECGLNGELTLIEKVYVSYHTYVQHKNKIIKETHWFLMDYRGDEMTIPQIKEGITEVCWKSLEESNKLACLTYPSISAVWDNYLI